MDDTISAPPLTVVMPFMGMGVGGSHVSGTLLGRGLIERYGTRVIVLAPEGAGALDQARAMGLTCVVSGDTPVDRVYDPMNMIRRLPNRLGLLRSFGPRSIVHTNDLTALQSWGLAARLAGIPVVHHDRAFGRLLPKKQVLRIANHIISISEATHSRLGRFAHRRRSLIHNPFETAGEWPRTELKQKLLEELRAPANSQIVGFVGNWWHRKRPFYFLDAAAHLARARPQTYFAMFGRPGEISGEELESAVRTRNLSSRTLVAGFRSPAARNIASLDVLAAPAVAEPFGRTPVEALFLGVPYVVTDDAGHGEILRRWGGGLAAGRSDPPEEFARLLDNVLQAPEAVTLPASKRAQVASDLSVSRHAGAVMEIYVRLRPSPGARHGSEAVAGL